MEIKRARLIAAGCWKASSSFTELSPAARKFMGALMSSKGRGSKGKCPRVLVRLILLWQLEKLILIPDPSVRVMALAAMTTMQHISKNLGLIASFYGSEQQGDLLDVEGRVIGEQSLSEQTRSYLFQVLNLNELAFFERLAEKAKHWEGCLAIDYSDDFRTERRRVEVDGKFAIKEYRLSDAELELRLTADRKEALALYRQDLTEYVRKYLKSDFVKKRTKEVYTGLDNIFRHLFTQEENKENVSKVLRLLDQFANWKHFPVSWLMELAQKNANQ